MKRNINCITFTHNKDGRIRFCVRAMCCASLQDVAQALGYSNTSKAIQQHVDHENKGTLPIRDTAYETRAVVINESGLYALILSSKLPQAKSSTAASGFTA